MAAKKKATAKAAKKAGQTPGKTEKTEKKKAESKAVEKKAPAKKTTVKETAKSKASAGTKESGKSVRGKAKNEQKVAPKAGYTVNLKPAKPALVAAPGVKITRKDNTRKNTERQNEVCKLTKKEIKDLQDDLLERRDVLLRGIRRELADHRNRANNRASDEADMASDAYDEDLTFEITSTSDKELKQIDDALKKIEEGTYGQCDRCGCHITASRLRILPYATACVDCRGKNEFEEQDTDENSPWAFIDGNDGDSEEE